MPDLTLPESDQPPTSPTDGPPTGDDRLELLEALDRNEGLPPRQRTSNTLTWVLAGLLAAGAMFVGGAWFQRTFGPEPAPTAGAGGAGGAAAAFAAAVRSGGLPAGISLPTSAAPTTAAPATAPSTTSGGGETRGTVKLVDGAKVYVATADGTIVIVTTNASTAVQVAAPGTLGDLKAGQAVTVQGAAQADGTVAATEIVRTTKG